MKRKILEITMSVMLLLGFFVLSQEAADTVNQQKTEEKTIVIDAGHGGWDPGMVGADGLQEKGINLSIAGKLEKILKENGYTPVMTRDSDEGLYDEGAQNKKAQDMQRRCEIIKESSPLLTISIHQNSYSDPSVYGAQVFYYEHSSEGKELAGCIQEHLNQDLGTGNPKEAKANASYYLLKRSEGVLNIVECGFLTNPAEARKLQQEEYQQKIAQSIYEGIEDYLQKKL